MESTPTKENSENTINLPNLFGILGIFLIGPVVWYYFGIVLLSNIFDTNIPLRIGIGSVEYSLAMLSILYLLGAISGIIGLVCGLCYGEIINKKIRGMEIGLIAGMSFWVVLSFSNAESIQISLLIFTAWVIGLGGCYFGKRLFKKIGYFLWKKILFKD